MPNVWWEQLQAKKASKAKQRLSTVLIFGGECYNSTEIGVRAENGEAYVSIP